jgi:hypothetical protein
LTSSCSCVCLPLLLLLLLLLLSYPLHHEEAPVRRTALQQQNSTGNNPNFIFSMLLQLLTQKSAHEKWQLLTSQPATPESKANQQCMHAQPCLQVRVSLHALLLECCCFAHTR